MSHSKTEISEKKRPETDLNSLLTIENLYVSVEGKNILNGVNLRINKGEIHTLMGPNGTRLVFAFLAFTASSRRQ